MHGCICTLVMGVIMQAHAVMHVRACARQLVWWQASCCVMSWVHSRRRSKRACYLQEHMVGLL